MRARKPDTIAKRLQRLGWSMRRLAIAAGIRPETVAATIREERKTHPGTLAIIEQALSRAEKEQGHGND